MATIGYDRNLIEDIILEILVRLPVETLLRFRCVCKHWKTLIDCSSFHVRHLRNNRAESQLFRGWCQRGFDMLNLDENFCEYEEPNYKCQIIDKVLALKGPLNGIFLICSKDDRMALFNPATRKFRLIPLNDMDIRHSLLGLRDEVEYGFGMDLISETYKIVLLMCFYDEDNVHCSTLVSVYDSSSDSWRQFENTDLVSSSRHISSSKRNTFLNGIYYWLVTSKGKTDGIFAFEMSSETFRDVKIPDCIKHREYGELCLHGDSLALFSCDKTNNIDLWIMRNEGCWNKSFTIGPFEVAVYPLGFWNNSSEVLSSKNDLLLSYNVNSGQLRTFESPIEDYEELDLICSYKESLISLKGDQSRFEELDISADAFKDFLETP